MLIKIVSHIDDVVTTTDELIPSGETSVYRSNPLRLAEFTLSRRDPDYVKKAKEVHLLNKDSQEVKDVLNILKQHNISYSDDMNIGSSIYANKPGDGSAREQAASCQRVLGGVSNFAKEYATKRYRSNCINWGMIPFITTNQDLLRTDTWVLCKDVISSIDEDKDVVAYVIDDNNINKIILSYGQLTSDEKEILKEGCLINFYKK